MNGDIHVPADHRALPWVIALGVAAIIVGTSLTLVLPGDPQTPSQVTVSH